MGKQKLWIISELFPPEETSTAYIMGEIANALSSKYEINVICGPEIYDKTRFRVSQSTSNDCYNLHRAPINTFNKNSLTGKIKSFYFTTKSLYSLAKKLIAPGDKVLMVTNPAPLVPLISKLKRKKGFVLNILIHDVFPENTKAAGLKVPFYSFFKKIFNKALSSSDKLIVLGRDMKSVILEKTKNAVPIEIIENWGDFDNILPIDFPSSEKIIIEYAGNIGRVQGLEEFVYNLPDEVEFHLYGSGALEDRLKSLNKSNVFFHGPYSRDEQTNVLGACHLSLVTLNEKMFGLGTPSKTYNILASGRPIIYFGPKNSEIELLINEYKIGYLGWPKYFDKEEIREMGERARKIGEKLYSKEIILKKFIEAI